MSLGFIDMDLGVFPHVKEFEKDWSYHLNELIQSVTSRGCLPNADEDGTFLSWSLQLSTSRKVGTGSWGMLHDWQYSIACRYPTRCIMDGSKNCS